MNEDINNRNDIQNLLIHFYEKVKRDPDIGFIFTDVANVNWETHIPIIVDFWETILLDNMVYKKNAMAIHYELNKKIPLQKKFFETWLSLFTATVDELYEGKIANLAKARAKSIAGTMQFKMEEINNNKSRI